MHQAIRDPRFREARDSTIVPIGRRQSTGAAAKCNASTHTHTHTPKRRVFPPWQYLKDRSESRDHAYFRTYSHRRAN